MMREVISLLIMRLGYECRNHGELLKLKQRAACAAARGISSEKGRPQGGF